MDNPYRPCRSAEVNPLAPRSTGAALSLGPLQGGCGGCPRAEVLELGRRQRPHPGLLCRTTVGGVCVSGLRRLSRFPWRLIV